MKDLYRPPRTHLSLLVLVLVAFSFGSTSWLARSTGSRDNVWIPSYAETVLSECDALYALPAVPVGFRNRTTSDRFEASASRTLITNATIWTGNRKGREVISTGEIVLENGIISYVGERAPAYLTSNNRIRRINARQAWVTPAIVDMHSHLGNIHLPFFWDNNDGGSIKGLTLPWLRSLDGIDTHDAAYPLAIAGGIATALIFPGSGNAISGQAFVIKTRQTKERSPLSRVVEPPWSLVNGTHVDLSIPPRWRHMKHATGENPSRMIEPGGTRMDTIWAYRSAYNEARKLKIQQDEYCAKARDHRWAEIPSQLPSDLKWEALVDVLRGKVKVNIHIYETTDFEAIVGLSNEFEFPIAAYHHASEAYLVPDLIKKTYGGAPGVALFATNARYKREAYRGSEFAAKILHENGIRVAVKSDHPMMDGHYLLHEATQVHYFGLEAAAALSAVTTTPATLIGMDHRLGFLRQGYDADVVMWDRHPLSLGATPQQVWIDGIEQLEQPHVLTVPEKLQYEPKVPNWDKEADDMLKYDGLPPLEVPEEKRRAGLVAFVNVRDVLQKDVGGSVRTLFQSTRPLGGTVIVEEGAIICAGKCVSLLAKVTSETVVDLAGGSIVPGLTAYGGSLGVVEIEGEPTTSDGPLSNFVEGETSPFLSDVAIRAVDGLSLGGRNMLLAYRSGVTSSITPPVSGGTFGGLSTAFSTGAKHKLEQGAVTQSVAALHVVIGKREGGVLSVSSQIAALRKALKGGTRGGLGQAFESVVNGTIPLVVEAQNADIIATLLELKAEIDTLSNTSIRLVLAGANEAHLLAHEIASAGVGVILAPARQMPMAWEGQRILSGPPLTPQSSIGVLLDANVTLGLGIFEGWQARNIRWDLGWAMLESNGTMTREDALALGSSNLETLLGVEPQLDLVAYRGGDVFDLSGRPAAIISPQRGFVDLL